MANLPREPHSDLHVGLAGKGSHSVLSAPPGVGWWRVKLSDRLKAYSTPTLLAMAGLPEHSSRLQQ